MEKREVEKLLKEQLPNKNMPGRRDVRKMIEDFIPHTTMKRWEEGRLIVNVNISKLRRETIKSQEVLMTENIRANERDFVLCKNKQEYIMIVQ